MFNSKSPTWMVNNARRVIVLLLLTVLAALLAACGGGSAQPQPSVQATRAPAPTSAAPTAKAASNDQGHLGEPKPPQACALLTVADVEKITGYTGGTATPTDQGDGASQCHIITGKGAFTIEVNVGAGTIPLLPGERAVVLEGSAIGKVSTQTALNQDWMTKINFPNYSVLMLAGGTATRIDPDKKIADITKADGSKITFGQAYEAFARAIAHNAASGAPAPSGVVKLGDPCTALTLDDVKQLAPGFDVTGPDYQDTTFGSKQCIYRFRSNALQAVGFVTLAFITQPKFDADMKDREPVSGIADAAGIAAGGTLLDFKKGSTFVYMTFSVASTDANSLPKIAPLQRDGLKQLAQKVAARIK